MKYWYEDEYLFDYDSTESNENCIIETKEFKKQELYDNYINIIMNFKKDIQYEPEFISIFNISSAEILKYICRINKNKNYKIRKKKKLTLNYEQYNLFFRLYKQLEFNFNDTSINLLANQIYNKLYI